MNTICLTGRMTGEPELKTTQSGVSVCSFTLAVKRPKVKDMTDFITCVVWRSGAEYLTRYGHKGNVAAVNGVLTCRKWQDRDGNNRQTFEVVADSVEIIGGQRNGDEKPQSTPPLQPKPQDIEMLDDEGLPF